MPVADVADADRSTSVYTAVLTALEDEVKLLAGLKFPVPERLLANVDAMCAGQPLEVSASYVPKEARPLLETGRPMLQATVRADDRMTFRPQTAADWLAESGL